MNYLAKIMICLFLCVGLTQQNCAVGQACKDEYDCTPLEFCQKGICLKKLKERSPFLEKVPLDAPRRERREEAQKETSTSEAKAETEPTRSDASPSDDASREATSSEPKADSNYPEALQEEQPQDIPLYCSGKATLPCYTGSPSTRGVGSCRSGIRRCRDKVWSNICENEVLPSPETCNQADDDCDGKVDEDFPQKGNPCRVSKKKGPCEEGKYACAKGNIICVSKYTSKAEICGNKVDDDCDGRIDGPPCSCTPGSKRSCYSGLPQTAGVGECKKGTQACNENGQWGSCKGEKKPSAEECDNKDNDCNGIKDDNITQPCFPSGQYGCFLDTSSRKWICRGACHLGVQVCRAGAWSACSSYTASQTEKCDGKDNDCDGKTDENFPNNGKTCTSKSYQGICSEGRWKCITAREICQPKNPPTTEKCRDSKDNDCDGKVDEICGSQYSYAVVSSTGSLRYKRNTLSSRKVATGTYELKTSQNERCGSVPIFLTPQTTSPIPMSYNCGRDSFLIRTGAPGTRQQALKDETFHAVLPAKQPGETWATVFTNRLPPMQTTLQNSYGKPAVRRVGVGVYEISSIHCSAPSRPVFTSIVNVKIVGYSSGSYYAPGKCRVYTFDLSGKPLDLTSAFWIPSTNAVMANLDGSGKIRFSTQSDSRAKWTATSKGISNNTLYTNVRFPALTTNSAILTTAANNFALGASVMSSSGGAYLFIRGINNSVSRSFVYSVLFVQ